MERKLRKTTPKDRRRAPRYVAYFPVKLEPNGRVERIGVCRDMSMSGGMIMTQTRMDIGQQVKVSLYLSDKTGPKTVGARVVRVVSRTTRNSYWNYDAAMEFEDLLIDTEPALIELSREQHRAGLY